MGLMLLQLFIAETVRGVSLLAEPFAALALVSVEIAFAPVNIARTPCNSTLLAIHAASRAASKGR